MGYNIDFSVASSDQIADALADRLKRIRLSRNLTQAALASEAGVSTNTIGRLEASLNVSSDTLIRVLVALGTQHNLSALLPDPTVRPVERVEHGGRERMRASKSSVSKTDSGWSWGDGGDDDDD